MSYLFNENPLVIDRELAVVIGLNEAMILQQMQYWIKKSEHKHESKTWIYNSVSQWKKQFPFFSESTINRSIKNLESKGLLFIGNYNKDRRDRTRWYSINYLELDAVMKNAISQNDECNKSICTNAISQNDQMQQVNLTSPLPEITTEITNNKHMSSGDDENAPNIKKTKPDYQAVLEAYQEVVLDGLPIPDKINQKRKALIDKLFKEIKNPSVETVKKYFIGLMDQVKDKPFYFGGPNHDGWKLNFDYVLRVDILTKTREGAL